MSHTAPLRTCVGCRAKKEKNRLARIFLDSQGCLRIERKEKQRGRGAYLCKSRAKGKKTKVNQKCLSQALKKNAFKYAFRKKVKKISLNSKTNQTTNSYHHGSC